MITLGPPDRADSLLYPAPSARTKRSTPSSVTAKSSWRSCAARGSAAAMCVPIAGDGTEATAEATFELDATRLAGRTLALRAILARDGRETATSDAADADSRVRVPRATLARTKDEVGRQILTVTCQNVEVGRDYAVRLVTEGDGEPVTVAEHTLHADTDAVSHAFKLVDGDASAVGRAEVTLDGHTVAVTGAEGDEAITPATGTAKPAAAVSGPQRPTRSSSRTDGDLAQTGEGLLLEVVAGTALALLFAGTLVSKDMRALASGGEGD